MDYYEGTSRFTDVLNKLELTPKSFRNGPFTSFNVSNTGTWTIGVDNSDSHSFNITGGNIIGIKKLP